MGLRPPRLPRHNVFVIVEMKIRLEGIGCLIGHQPGPLAGCLVTDQLGCTNPYQFGVRTLSHLSL